MDVRPFKQALLNIIKRWSFMFKQHLIDHVTNSLNDLADFIKTADKGLLTPVEEGDYQGLVDVMGHLMAVKDRQATTDEMFEPLKQTIELLKTYDQEMPEVVGFLIKCFSVLFYSSLSLKNKEPLDFNRFFHSDALCLACFPVGWPVVCAKNTEVDKREPVKKACMVCHLVWSVHIVAFHNYGNLSN